MTELQGARIHITGIVQGVGFRPFVYNLATQLKLTGWVRNTAAGVDIAANGSQANLAEFTTRLRVDAPPLAQIHSLEVTACPADGYATFEIILSAGAAGDFQPISPDVCVCPDCLRELFDPGNRRYRYPFTNCTNCGPRFTIIQDIPYDRPKTTMAGFALCPDCQAEYQDPSDRRFHAQPVACPTCGPHIWLEKPGETSPAYPPVLETEAAMLATQRLLAEGQIVAIKGLGGFHLACDAQNPAAVEHLRQRKLRVDKPFALMVPDLATASQHCSISPAEAELLSSVARPIVLLTRLPESTIARAVAPGQSTLGVMLPYTPLHYLLFAAPADPTIAPCAPQALVMTSGNLSEEPIATQDDEARQRLAPLADAFLMHNRPIHTRCDDSVVRSVGPEADGILPIRRARGYAPFPVRLPRQAPPLLATGAELKNTFCLLRGEYAFLSHHIGDLENYETLQAFEQGIAHFERLFRIEPQALAYDLHPDYLATRYALERAEHSGLPALGVQHHHAHIAAGMLENGIPEGDTVLGIALDGTGYGTDGAIWGGEFILADYTGFQRAAHLAYIPLAGGDRAVRQPWRTALSWLAHAGIDWTPDLLPLRHAVQSSPEPDAQVKATRKQIETGLNAPLTSSMGRLFDAVAALLGIRQVINYEAQAAIELEAACDPHETGLYPCEMRTIQADHPLQLDPSPLLQVMLSDWRSGVAVSVLAARFHNSLAEAILQTALHIRLSTSIRRVVLSGGVWQNTTLLAAVLKRLQGAGFLVHTHHQVPPNDGGIALGQAAVALHTLWRN